jgi:DNA mismatch endonuclease (patch repair protein)
VLIFSNKDEFEIGITKVKDINCRYFIVPKTRTEWWLNKINSNITNDTKAVKALKKEGWKIINLWECDLKTVKVKRTFERLLRRLII